MLRALLCHRRSDRSKSNQAVAELVQSLETVGIDDIAGSEDDNLPILRAARILTALSAAPDSALSATAIYCFYVITRELHTGDAPDWLIGGARGGEGLPSCAFVTNECIHALLSLEQALQHTAEYIEGIAGMLDRRRRPESLDIFSERKIWSDLDDRRATLDFQITSELRKENIALKLPPIEGGGIAAFLQDVTPTIRGQIEECVDNLHFAIREIQRYFTKTDNEMRQRDPEGTTRQIRAKAGHDLAMSILQAAADRAPLKEMAAAGDPSRDDAVRGAAINSAAAFLRRVAGDVRRALEPSAAYVSRALDRELTAAASGAAVWDAGELLFAAISHGYISGRWDEERLKLAAEYSARVVSERGRFPVGHPIHFSGRGYNLHVLNVDIIRAFAELLHHAKSVSLEPTCIKRLMHFIDDTMATGTPDTWVPSEELRDGVPWRSATASTVLALDALNRMLDVRINHEVLKHFSSRETEGLDVPELNELFYPDYGLCSELCPEEIRRSESVAVTLERMRAHVRGVQLPDYPERLFSLVLHGPTGTGKSTLVESLAKSCRAVLVEVTPSDLIAGGVDAIEGTTRAVFRALSLLTRVVIVFDEFDPVLLQRQDDQQEATAFSFLTPGMLPKLKALHEAAKRRSVAYVLNTNLIGKLDDAAIRGGRFDRKVGIYPPDILSRAGRLAAAVSDYYFSPNRSDTVSTRAPQLKERFERAVLSLRLAPMNTLATKGWFIAPNEVRQREDVFDYLVNGRSMRRLEPEMEPRFSSDKNVAVRELQEFVWVARWDTIGLNSLTSSSEDGKTQYSERLLPATYTPERPPLEDDSRTGGFRVTTLSEVLHRAPPHQDVLAEVEQLRMRSVTGPVATKSTNVPKRSRRSKSPETRE